MRLISLSFAILVSVLLTGCPEGATGTSCATPADCDDLDPCTNDLCENGTCDHTSAMGTPACPGPCTTDEECADNDVCTTNYCGEDGMCGFNVVTANPACESCDFDDACQPEDNCFCAECADDPRCAKAADCTEILAEDLTQFGEGPVTDVDGNDLEGAGTDIMQVFDNDFADGVFDFVDIADHDDCFAAGGGCAQLRLNFDGTPIEAMFTTGSWLHNADDSGEIAGATAFEYTQGVGGVMTYVPDGRCYWLASAHYEP